MKLVDSLVSPRQLLRTKITKLSSSFRHTIMLLAVLAFIPGCSGGGDGASSSAPAPVAACIQNSTSSVRLHNNSIPATIQLLINGAVVSVNGQTITAAPGQFSVFYEVAARQNVPFFVSAQRIDNNQILTAFSIPTRNPCDTDTLTY